MASAKASALHAKVPRPERQDALWTHGQRRRGGGLGDGLPNLPDRGRVAPSQRLARMQRAACLVPRGSVVGRLSTAPAAFKE